MLNKFMGKTKRVVVPAMEEILEKEFPALDKGFIRLVDYMGGDASIVQAARVSYGVGTKKVSEDRGLIRYLMRHRHTTPFEMAEIKFHIKVPMDTWRQWIRHRTANVNEYSTRYSVAIDDAQQTSENEWRMQSSSNKQGSEEFFPPKLGREFTIQETEVQKYARKVYEKRIAAGMAREQARKDLPLSTYTEAYWKIDLHNLLHFSGLRMDSHAQKEISDYAKIIGNEIIAKWVPLTWEAFLDYRMNAKIFSGPEIKFLKERGIFTNLNLEDLDLYQGSGFVNEKGVLTREGKEFQEKLKLLQGS